MQVIMQNPPEIYTRELEQLQKMENVHSERVLELVKNIFLPSAKRRSASQLLELPFFTVGQ